MTPASRALSRGRRRSRADFGHERRQAERRLRTDTPFYAEKCLTIVDQGAHQIPCVFNEAQRHVDGVLESQRAEGKPMRAVILKARKLGMSTGIEAKITHRYTTRANHHAVVVAHDKTTASEIFAMSELMYANLPNREVGELVLKPPVSRSRAKQRIELGVEAREEVSVEDVLDDDAAVVLERGGHPLDGVGGGEAGQGGGHVSSSGDLRAILL